MIQQQAQTTAVRPGCEYFPRVIHSLDELPDPVRGAVPQVHVRKIIHMPSHSYPVRRTFWRYDLTLGWRRTPPRTLVFADEQIIIVEELTGDSLRTIVIPLVDLLSIRLVSVLLYMYFELAWLSGDHCETIKIEFNAVGERMLKGELDHARSTIAQRLVPLAPFEEASIKHFPFKFQSYTYGDLLPGEKMRLGIYEPKIRTPNRHIRSFLSPNRVIVLTDQHLNVFEDRNRRFMEADISTYWMERCYVPRAQIRDIRFEDEPDVTWMNLCLGDQSSHDIRLPLLKDSAAALREAVPDWLAPAAVVLH